MDLPKFVATVTVSSQGGGSLGWTEDLTGIIALTAVEGDGIPIPLTKSDLASLVVTQRMVSHFGAVNSTAGPTQSLPNTFAFEEEGGGGNPTRASMSFLIPRLGVDLVGDTYLPEGSETIPMAVVTSVSTKVYSEISYDVTRDFLQAAGALSTPEEGDDLSTTSLETLHIVPTLFQLLPPFRVSSQVMPQGLLRIRHEGLLAKTTVNIEAVTFHPLSTNLAMDTPSVSAAVSFGPYGDRLGLTVARHVPPHGATVALRFFEIYDVLFSLMSQHTLSGELQSFGTTALRTVYTTQYTLADDEGGTTPPTVSRLVSAVTWRLPELIGAWGPTSPRGAASPPTARGPSVLPSLFPSPQIVSAEALCTCAECRTKRQ